MPSPLTTGSVYAKTSYSQIQKMLLSIFVIRALPRGFFLSRNPRIIRRGIGKLTILVTIKKP
jgi:hypothetical protein